MKKKYIAPSMVAVKVKSITTMLSGSINDTNVGLNKGGGTYEGGIIEGNSRHSSLWSDDE